MEGSRGGGVEGGVPRAFDRQTLAESWLIDLNNIHARGYEIVDLITHCKRELRGCCVA